MFISEKYKYIFIGLRFSASSALSKELIEMYDSEPILHKHANIPYFIKKYPKLEINQNFKFAVLRDPVQIMHTIFNKYLTHAHFVLLIQNIL